MKKKIIVGFSLLIHLNSLISFASLTLEGGDKVASGLLVKAGMQREQEGELTTGEKESKDRGKERETISIGGRFPYISAGDRALSVIMQDEYTKKLLKTAQNDDEKGFKKLLYADGDKEAMAKVSSLLFHLLKAIPHSEGGKKKALSPLQQRVYNEQLYKAICDGNSKFLEIETLLKAGATNDFIDQETGFTPLHKAAMAGHAAIVELLLENGFNIEALTPTPTPSSPAKNRFITWTPLHAAADRGHIEVVKLLIERSANIGAVDGHGQTPLHKSTLIENGKEIVKMLLEARADVNIRDKQGRTPLRLADRDRILGRTEESRAVIVKLLKQAAEKNELT